MCTMTICRVMSNVIRYNLFLAPSLRIHKWFLEGNSMHVSRYCLIQQAVYHLSVFRALWKLKVATIWEKDLNRHFIKESIWMTNKHMKTFSTSWVIWEMWLNNEIDTPTHWLESPSKKMNNYGLPWWCSG